MANFLPITAATAGSITTPASLVANSSVQFSWPIPGPGTLQFWVEGVFTGLVLNVYTTSPSGTLELVDPSLIVRQANLLSGAPTTFGSYTCEVGGGAVYIIATALGSGQVQVTPQSGAPGGSIGSSGGGGEVSSSIPWGAPLPNWLFAGVSGAVTVTGYFVDPNGIQQGVSANFSVGASNPGVFAGAGFASFIAGGIPAAAVAFVIRVTTGSLYYSTGAVTQAADFKNNTTQYPVLLTIPDYQLIGGQA